MSVPVKNLRLNLQEGNFLDRKTGDRGEVFFDKANNTLRLYDGSTGGFQLSRADLANVTVSHFRSKSVAVKLATVVYAVTIMGPQAPDVGNKYVLNGVYRPIPNFVVGYTYVFDQSDDTNVYFPNANGTTANPHPLNFSSDNISGERGGGTSYLAQVEYRLNGVVVTQAVYNSIAFNTATARQVQITITNATPATLYYWCYNHVLMGNEIAVADPGSGSSGPSVSVSSTVPATPTPGNLWLDVDSGILYVYFNDGDSAQWIQPIFPYPDLTAYATTQALNTAVASLATTQALNTAVASLATTQALNTAVASLATTVYVDTAVSTFEFAIAADDSTQRVISNGETLQFVGAAGITTVSDAEGTITISAAGVSGLASRTNAAASTGSIADAATATPTVTGFKGYVLYKIQTSAAAWVRIYSSVAARTADIARLENVDPLPGSGVIAEIISTTAETILITPGTIGFNDESSPNTNIALAVTNKSGGTADITVTLTIVQVEA